MIEEKNCLRAQAEESLAIFSLNYVGTFNSLEIGNWDHVMIDSVKAARCAVCWR